ncbi:MAG: hypothetical protein ACTSQE_13495 [Candidatus Heimdallarchaeaceae archaeon]
MQKPEERKDIINSKAFFIQSQSLILLLISLVILVFLHVFNIVSGVESNVLADYPEGYLNSFHLSVSVEEWFLISAIFLLSLIFMYVSIYWFINRFIRIVGYDRKINRVKFKMHLAVFGFAIQLIISIGLSILDEFYMDLKKGDPYNSWSFINQTNL